MVLRQTILQKWCHPYQRRPGRDDAGSLASSATPQAIGASANQEVRRKQSKATDQHQNPTHANIALWNYEGLQRKKPELQKFLQENRIGVVCIQEFMMTENQ
ncbi:hypothetical protein ElyMa_000724000 [Elysia marginata]|uniref:Endonuclease/exonuclease/phosphatase domain-containing protein n=1 Tax=Elysia marginata TaxID=1093978 RepID=A0AAV4GM77_9GAST|nr:hypothetical protein ElyMa_000724000 [Elysia marginata]